MGNLEETAAREVLDTIGRMGLNWVIKSKTHYPLLEHGLRCGFFDWSELNEAELQYREKKAREALGVVRGMSLNWVNGSGTHNSHLEYGLEEGFFDKSEVDEAELQYREKEAKKALDVVRSWGEDWVRGSGVFGLHLEYGLINGIFDQSEVDKAQRKYKSTH